MPQKIIAARALPMISATSRIVPASMPQTGAIASGVNVFRCSLNPSNPSVKPAM